MNADRRHDGYREEPRGGARIRADVVDVYIFRRENTAGASNPPGAIEFLQLRRAKEPLKGTWHPLMGHVEDGERCAECALRELREEVGLSPNDPQCRGVWALEQVHPYYVPQIDSVVLSPRFVVEAAPGWEPKRNDEHDAHRWVDAASVESSFLWPGQKAACAEIVREIAPDGSASRAHLRIV